MNNFSKIFSQLINDNGEQNQIIAQKLNITKSHLSNLKSGYNEPSIDLLIKIANYFNVTIDYLVGRTNY